jgi:hypothetical protein
MMIVVALMGLALAVLELRERRRFASALEAARTDYLNAKFTCDLAAIRIDEYEEVIFPTDMRTVDDEVAKARTERSLAADQLANADKRWGPSSLVPYRLAVQRAVFLEEQAVSKKKVLEDYTKIKTIRELKSDLAIARANELLRKMTYEQVKATGGSLIGRIMNQK